MDESRHVEVFSRYLEKLGLRYDINDNLYVLIEALMNTSEWDLKFLGMQILIEGLALEQFCKTGLSERERRFREEWAFEVLRLMRNRFLAHEIYDQFYGHRMTRRDWDRLVGESETMGLFRGTMLRRIMPNLLRIGLLSERIRPHYAELGVLHYASGRSAPDLTPEDLY